MLFALLIVGGVVFNGFTRGPRLPALPEAASHWTAMPGREEALPQAEFAAGPDLAPAPGAYVRSALAAMLGSWGPGDHDYLTSKLFWLAAGSPDTLAPVELASGLTVFFALGLALLFLRVTETRSSRRLILAVGLLLAAGVWLALLAWSARMTPGSAGLQGRHLAGIYLLLLGLGFLGWKGPILILQQRIPVAVPLLLAGAVLTVHVSASLAVIERYFF